MSICSLLNEVENHGPLWQLQLRGGSRTCAGALPGGRADPQQTGNRSVAAGSPPWRSSLNGSAQLVDTSRGLAIFMPPVFSSATPGVTRWNAADSWDPLCAGQGDHPAGTRAPAISLPDLVAEAPGLISAGPQRAIRSGSSIARRPLGSSGRGSSSQPQPEPAAQGVPATVRCATGLDDTQTAVMPPLANQGRFKSQRGRPAPVRGDDKARWAPAARRPVPAADSAGLGSRREKLTGRGHQGPGLWARWRATDGESSRRLPRQV